MRYLKLFAELRELTMTDGIYRAKLVSGESTPMQKMVLMNWGMGGNLEVK